VRLRSEEQLASSRNAIEQFVVAAVSLNE
jgi:hypothetical protein